MSKKISNLSKITGILIINLILFSIIKFIIKVSKIHIGTVDSIPFLISTLLVVLIFGRTLYVSFKKDSIKRAMLGLFTGAIFAIVFIIVFIVTSQGSLNFGVFKPFLRGQFNLDILLVLLNLFIYAISEEILFRGFVFNSVKKEFSIASAIIIAAFLNSFLGFSFAKETPILFMNQFLISALLTLLFNKVTSLEYCILFNFTIKIATVLFINTKGLDTVSGGNNGVLNGLLCMVIFVPALIYLVYKEKIVFSIKTIILPGIMFLLVIIYVGFNASIWYTPAAASSAKAIKEVAINNNINNYNLRWQIDPDNMQVNGTEEVNYINTSKDSLGEIYFHAYAAAFKEYAGDIKFKDVTVEGKAADFSIEGQDSTLLKINLKNKLMPEERVKLKLSYTIDIPKNRGDGYTDRFAYSNNTINLGNCMPIAAVYEAGKWDKHPYDKKGDAFYSECSNFTVDIIAPKEYELAVTGEVKRVEQTGKLKNWKVTANNVRDFALVASNKFQMVEENVEGTIVKSYAFDKTKAKKVLDISAKAIKDFNKRFGEYPYSTCSVVQTDLLGGMEYPTMVMIESNCYNNITAMNLVNPVIYKGFIGNLENVVVHELAHQWWYGLVGDDEYDESWVDEPMTQFSTLLYYKDIYGEDIFERLYEYSIKLPYESGKGLIKNDTYKRPLNKFDEQEYEDLIYLKVPILIKEKYDEIGDEKFNEIFRECFSEYQFKVLKGKDFPLDLKDN